MTQRHQWGTAEMVRWAERADAYVEAGRTFDSTPAGRERYAAAQAAWGGGYDHAAMLAACLPALRHYEAIGR